MHMGPAMDNTLANEYELFADAQMNHIHSMCHARARLTRL